MVIKLFLIIFLSSILNTTFALEMKLGACQSKANDFILKGSQTSSEVGARLWDFKKLSSLFADREGSECEHKTLNQANLEDNEYWTHIKEKYNCPAEGVHQCDSAESNLSYLKLMKDLYDSSTVVPDAEKAKKCHTPPPNLSHRKKTNS